MSVYSIELCLGVGIAFVDSLYLKETLSSHWILAFAKTPTIPSAKLTPTSEMCKSYKYYCNIIVGVSLVPARVLLHKNLNRKIQTWRVQTKN